MNNIEKIVDILESGQQPSRSECSFFVNKVFSGGVDKDVITKILRLFNNVGFDAPQLSGFAESMRKVSKKVICKKNIVDNSIEVLFKNEDISRHLRTEETAIQASKISSLSSTREILLPIQRFFSETSNLIADGRDMGSVVFPNANLKFFLDAAPEVRAKRRHLELQKRGQEVNMHDLINDIVERDKKDRTRDLSPLIKTEDSILLDSTNLDQESILNEALQHIKERNIL